KTRNRRQIAARAVEGPGGKIMIARVRVRDIPFEEMVEITRLCPRIRAPSREVWEKSRGRFMAIETETAYRAECGRIHWTITDESVLELAGDYYPTCVLTVCEAQVEA